MITAVIKGLTYRCEAASIKPKPSIKGYITLGIREVYVYRKSMLLAVIIHNPPIYSRSKNFRAAREVWRTKLIIFKAYDTC